MIGQRLARTKKIGRLFAGVALATLAACTYRGEPANPVERTLTWFSYIGGEDIRASCRNNGHDRYRFVYNGHYELEIRAYDLTPVPDGAELIVRARGRSGEIKRFSADAPLGPWALDRDAMSLSNREAGQIVRTLSDAAASVPRAAGQSMESYEFYWIVSACTAGRFRLFVFRWPKTDIDSLPFVPLLRVYDNTGVPFGKARYVEGMKEPSFNIEINAAGDGLVGR